jgi:hypothetical protein
MARSPKRHALSEDLPVIPDFFPQMKVVAVSAKQCTTISGDVTSVSRDMSEMGVNAQKKFSLHAAFGSSFWFQTGVRSTRGSVSRDFAWPCRQR